MSQTKAQLIDPADGSIVTADLADDAVNADKLASNSVVSASIVDGSIVNADINASAAIAGSKINPSFGDQAIVTSHSLTVDGTVGDTIIAESGAEISFTRAASNNITCSDSSGSLNLNTGGSNTRLHIKADGKVGVGTTSPSALIHASLAAENGSIAQFGLSGQTNNQSFIIKADDSDSLFTFRFGSTNSTYPAVRFNMGADAEAMRIDSSGRVLIGTTTEGNSSADNLTVAGSDNVGITIRSGTAHQGAIYFSDATSGNAEFDGFLVYNQNSRELLFGTQQSTRGRFDAGGRFLINTPSSINSDGFQSYLQIAGTNSHTSSLYAARFSDNASAPFLVLAKSRNGTIGSNSVVQSGDDLGVILFHGNDGSGFHEGARISAEVETGVGNDDLPTAITFKTNSGSTVVTEKMRISSDGHVGIKTTPTTFGQLCVGVPSQSGGSALQVHNSTSGSGDGGTTNIVLRSVNSGANNWAHAEYRAHSHKFLHQATTKVTINTNGLCFNTDTAAANALDDYEEGTFTPTYNTGTAASAMFDSCGYSQTTGEYTKVGRLVTFAFRIQATNIVGANSGSSVIITGLPFTSLGSGHGQGGAVFNYSQAVNSSNNGYLPTMHISNGSTNLLFFTTNGNQYTVGDTNNQFLHTLHIHGQYYTA